MLVIDLEACIDCGVCVPECPAEAIIADDEDGAEEKWLELNEKYAAIGVLPKLRIQLGFDRLMDQFLCAGL